MKKLVWQAYKDVVDIIIKARPELKRENITIEPGYVASTGSKFWKAWVLEAMFEEDRNDVNSEYNKLLETYKKRFNNAKFNKDDGITFNIKNPKHVEKFEKTLLKKDSYRTGVNKLVKELVDPKGPYYEKLLNRLRSIFNSEIRIVETD